MKGIGSRPAELRSSAGWWVLLVGITGLVWALYAQHVEKTPLQREIRALRVQTGVTDRLLAESRALAETQLSTRELESLRQDREAVVRMRRELDSLRHTGRSHPSSPVVPQEKAGATIDEAIVPASAWQNAGYGTAAAAVETALWAAAGGDVEVLAESFILEKTARTKAEALLAALPAEVRERYASPEMLVALLTAKDVPLVGARIINTGVDAPGGKKLLVQLRTHTGTVLPTHLVARETKAGWRLVVPEKAVEKYAELLKGSWAKPPRNLSTGMPTGQAGEDSRDERRRDALKK